MKLLLDTNALIWWISDPTQLSGKADRAMRSGANQLVVSIVSLWELAIKIGTGKLTTMGSSIHYVVDELREQRIDLLPVTLPHIYRLERLDPIHRDPFDRLLVAQALEEQLPIVTTDRLFASYGVDIYW